MRQRPTIGIVGAEPAGLVAANVLKRHGWTVAVFEADLAEASRDQGGTLDLHPEDGQLALRKAGLLDVFLAQARHDDQGNCALDHATADILRDVAPEPGSGDRPEIDRNELRGMLLEPHGRDVVCWGPHGRNGRPRHLSRDGSVTFGALFEAAQ